MTQGTASDEKLIVKVTATTVSREADLLAFDVRDQAEIDETRRSEKLGTPPRAYARASLASRVMDG